VTKVRSLPAPLLRSLISAPVIVALFWSNTRPATEASDDWASVASVVASKITIAPKKSGKRGVMNNCSSRDQIWLTAKADVKPISLLKMVFDFNSESGLYCLTDLSVKAVFKSADGD
jgi:hypothetical protein